MGTGPVNHDTQHYRIALDVYRAIYNAINIRGACQSIYKHLREIISFDRLFCITPIKVKETDNYKISYDAFIDNNIEQHLSDRRLTQNDILTQIFMWGGSISNDDWVETSRHLGPELTEVKSWVVIPLISSSENVVGILGFCRNGSESFSNLEKDIFSVIGSALTQFMIIQNNIKRVKEKERELVIGELAANLLHDIRNDFGTIPFTIQFIEDELKNSGIKLPQGIELQLLEIDKQAREIEEKTVQRMAEIKQALVTPSMELIVIGDLLQELLGSLDLKNCTLFTDFAPLVPNVLAYRRNLADAFRNIIQNALQAMQSTSKKELSISVNTFTDSKALEWIQVDIKDTGIGINAEQLSKIWLLSYSTKSSIGGFGLYWTKKIIEEGNGIIDVFSQVDSGTTFTVKLPASHEVQIQKG